MIVKTRVRRGGEVLEIRAEQVVPGDIVLVEAGDRVPADGRLINAATLEIDESALTGESAPVPKEIAPVSKVDTPLGDRVDMAYMNTERHAWHRRDPGHRDRHVDRGWTHLRVAAGDRARRDAAHQAAQHADRTDRRDCRGWRWPSPSPSATSAIADRRPLPDRRCIRRLGHPDRPARRRHLSARYRHHRARRRRRHCQAAALGRDAGSDLRHQLRQDRHAHAQPDDGRRDGDPRPALHDHWKRLLD